MFFLMIEFWELSIGNGKKQTKINDFGILYWRMSCSRLYDAGKHFLYPV